MSSPELLKHGPDTSDGPAVIDNLPETLSPRVKLALVRRAEAGEEKYGTKLRVGFPHAREALAQELGDSIMYALALGLDPQGPWVRSLDGMMNALLVDETGNNKEVG